MVRNSQGQLKWGWGAAGSGPSPKVVPRAWTSKIISSKATGSYCLLWTNISSAEEGQQPSPSHSTGLSRLSTACVKVMQNFSCICYGIYTLCGNCELIMQCSLWCRRQ